VLVVEFVVLPLLGGFRQSLNRVSHINIAYVIAGLILEAAALAAYAQLTYTVLSPGDRIGGGCCASTCRAWPSAMSCREGRLPGWGCRTGCSPSPGVRHGRRRFRPGHAGGGIGRRPERPVLVGAHRVVVHQRLPSAVHLRRGGGDALMGSFAAVIVALTKGRRRSIEVVRQWADHVPFLNGDHLAEGVQRVADRLKSLAGQKDLLRQAVLWAAANWLLDAACLFVFIVALHGYVSPINLLVAYGLANILAVIPITPGGLGIIEGILIPALHGFGVPLTWPAGRPRLPGGELLAAHPGGRVSATCRCGSNLSAGASASAGRARRSSSTRRAVVQRSPIVEVAPLSKRQGRSVIDSTDDIPRNRGSRHRGFVGSDRNRTRPPDPDPRHEHGDAAAG
jgi:hypothetical protein